MVIIQLLICLLFPAIALILAKRYKLFDLMGPVLMCYFAGMILGNLSFIEIHIKTAEAITEATIPLAIPMLLFSAQFKTWLSHSKTAVLSFGLAVLAVIISALTTAYVLGHTIQDPAYIAAMLSGTYTGGTPNMLSVGAALGAQKDLIVLLNVADVIVSGTYLLFLMSLAKPILSRFYPAYKQDDAIIETQVIEPNHSHKTKAWGILRSGLLSILIVLVSVGLTFLLFGKLEVAAIIFGITTGGIIGSLNTKIRQLPASYDGGNYLILIFCVAVGTMTNFSDLIGAGRHVILFCCMLMTMTVTLHYLFARLAKIDVDTLIITSTATILGPAFVGLITESIHNRQVLLSGLTTGLVGYAVGNYLGLFIAYILTAFLL